MPDKAIIELREQLVQAQAPAKELAAALEQERTKPSAAAPPLQVEAQPCEGAPPPQVSQRTHKPLRESIS